MAQEKGCLLRGWSEWFSILINYVMLAHNCLINLRGFDALLALVGTRLTCAAQTYMEAKTYNIENRKKERTVRRCGLPLELQVVHVLTGTYFQ